MTTTNRPRVDAGVPAGGEFKAYGHSDAVPTLGAPAAAPAGLDLETVLAAAAVSIGPGIIPELERQYDSLDTDAGRQLLLQKWNGHYGEGARRYGHSNHDLTPENCDKLAAIGYTDLDQVSAENLLNIDIPTIVHQGVTPDRLAVINRLALPQYRWSEWEREAVFTADVEDLDALLQTAIPTAEEKYLATVALLGPEKYNRAKEALAGGLRFHEKGLIESDQDPAVLAGLRNALPDSKRGDWHIVGLAKKGITGDHLKAYGSKACETFTAPELDSSGVKPAVLKSLLSSGVRGDIAFYRKLSEGGFTKGSDLKDASGALETTNPAALVRARKHATGEQMAVFKRAIRKEITLTDVKAIGRLAKAGITEPSQLRPWTAANHREANRYVGAEDKSVLAMHADVIEAGLSPERLGAMSRAGIPVTEAVRLKDAADLWEAGKPFREKFAVEEQHRFDQGWIRKTTPWAFTKDTYLDGAEE